MLSLLLIIYLRSLEDPLDQEVLAELADQEDQEDQAELVEAAAEVVALDMLQYMIHHQDITLDLDTMLAKLAVVVVVVQEHLLVQAAQAVLATYLDHLIRQVVQADPRLVELVAQEQVLVAI